MKQCMKNSPLTSFRYHSFRYQNMSGRPLWIRHTLTSLVCLLSVLLSLGCSAEPKSTAVIAGKHYKKIAESIERVGPLDTVEVMEFFSYGCPHCAHLEPGLVKWTSDLPTYVKFDHTPAFWNEHFSRLAQAYYTASILKKEHELRGKIFDALHKKHQSWKSDEAVRDFFVQQGIDGATFDKTFHSFAVKQKMKMADNAFRRYKLRSVPVFVVAGQYVTSLGDAGSEEQLWRTLNHLTAKVKAGDL